MNDLSNLPTFAVLECNPRVARQTFPDARAGFDHQVAIVREGVGDCAQHFLLFGALFVKLEIIGEGSAIFEDGGDFIDIQCNWFGDRAQGWNFSTLFRLAEHRAVIYLLLDRFTPFPCGVPLGYLGLLASALAQGILESIVAIPVK